MKRMVVSAGLASLAIFLTGCMQWQTVGTVDMSNVMTPAQVWEKQDSLIGKVVTIVLDTVISPLTGGRFLPTGEDYSVTGFHLNERYYRADDHVRAWRTHIDSVGRENGSR